MTDQVEREKQWSKSAMRLARVLRVGWCLDFLAKPLLVVALLAGAVVVWFRYRQIELGTGFFVGLGLVVLLSVIWAWRKSSSYQLSREEAFARLESDLQLNSALTSAHCGRISWPSLPLEEPSLLRWNVGRVAAPFSCALLFFLLAALVPISPAAAPAPVNQPYTWTALSEEIAELVEDETIQEDYAEEFAKRLEELRQQKASEWFSAASLEATDSLRKAHANEVAELERDLMRAEQALKQMADPKATEQQREEMKKQFEEAVEGMRGGPMKPNEDLLEKLEKAAEKGMEGMGEGEREKLRERLRQRAKELGDALGEGFGEEEPPPGMGGPGEGPGAAGDLFGEKSEDLKLKKFERLDPQENDEPVPGDLLKLEEIEHDQEKKFKGPQMSGEAKSRGVGGDRVWKDSLDPDEQKSLKHFFE